MEKRSRPDRDVKTNFRRIKNKCQLALLMEVCVLISNLNFYFSPELIIDQLVCDHAAARFVKAFSFDTQQKVENIGCEMINIDWNGYDNASTHSTTFSMFQTSIAI